MSRKCTSQVKQVHPRLSHRVIKLLSLLLIAAGLTLTDSKKISSSNIRKNDDDPSYLEVAIQLIEKARRESSGIVTCSNSSFTGRPLDCADILRNGSTISGEYTIWPNSRVTNGKSILVYCDMKTDGGGWTVIQRRGSFSNDADYFFKDWNAYKHGFGNVERDFWLGNDNIYAISNQKVYSARFDLKDVKGEERYELYKRFWIDDEDHKYTLHLHGCKGTAGDSMLYEHNNRKFSTKDQDNDKSEQYSCAQQFKGGWWYGNCYTANLNGLYLPGQINKEGVVWNKWQDEKESLASTEIKLRPKDFKIIV